MKDAGIHIEITDLVVPKIGDNLESLKSMLLKLKDILGLDVPISFLRFFPYYKLSYLEPTPYETLISHYKTAKSMGFKFVYIGNVPGSKYQNTYCPNCKRLLVKRDNMSTIKLNLTKEGRCKYCGYDIGYKLI